MSKTHQISQHTHDGDKWGEFECAKCLCDLDFFDDELADIVELSTSGCEFACPNCGFMALLEGRKNDVC